MNTNQNHWGEWDDDPELIDEYALEDGSGQNSSEGQPDDGQDEAHPDARNAKQEERQ